MATKTNGRMFPRSRRAVITATGSAVPAQVLDNADLERMVDTSDEWIMTRTGISERRIASNGETTASLSLAASRQVLERAGVAAEELDLIICATITPEMVCPATACFVQEGLGVKGCGAFDLAAACSGFTYAMATGAAFIGTGQNKNVLVIGAETLSHITDYTDRSSCILFGDGAGAVLLQSEEDTDDGLLYSSTHADGAAWETISCQAHGSRFPINNGLDDPKKCYLNVRGRETYQTAVRTIVDLIEQVYRTCNVTTEDIGLIIPHQSNVRIVESVAKRLNVGTEKFFVNIERYGNTSAASIPIALNEAVEGGHVKKGDLVLLVAFGAGLTWGVNLIRY